VEQWLRKWQDVTLHKGHLDICREEAENSRANGLKIGARGNQYAPEAFSQLDAHYIGALGEYATSIFTGYPDHFFEDYVPGRADVGLIEVRTRSVGKEPILRIYEKDPHPFTVLAVVKTLTDEGAVVRLCGWVFTQIGWSYGTKVGQHWKKGVEYQLSENFVRPMGTLLKHHKEAEAFYEFQSR